MSTAINLAGPADDDRLLSLMGATTKKLAYPMMTPTVLL